MEGELTHIQRLLRLSDNAGMLYLWNKSVPSIEPQQTWMLRALILVNPHELSAYLTGYFTCFVKLVIPGPILRVNRHHVVILRIRNIIIFTSVPV